MKPFYSLVKIAPNPSSGDNISIGLILKDKNGFKFEFSKDRKNIAKKLLNDKSNIIDYIEAQITDKLDEINKMATDDKQAPNYIDHKFTENYFAYLSKYCNGILQFSSPANLNDQTGEINFDKLFHLLVGNFSSMVPAVHSS